MAGLYDNEQRIYVELPELEQGDWFLDEDRILYIYPTDGGNEHAPDNEINDALLSLYRLKNGPSDKDLEILGLTRVPAVLKRFSPSQGYFTA